MNNTAKKLMIYSLACVLQVGLGATLVEASPFHNDGSLRVVQLNGRNHNDNQREHDRRQREENDRHEREMQRHDRESDREWHERQERENHRHNEALHEIEAFLIGVGIGSILK